MKTCINISSCILASVSTIYQTFYFMCTCCKSKPVKADKNELWGTGQYQGRPSDRNVWFSSTVCSEARLWIFWHSAGVRRCRYPQCSCRQLYKYAKSSQCGEAWGGGVGAIQEVWMLIVSFRVRTHTSCTDMFHHLYSLTTYYQLLQKETTNSLFTF